MVDIRNIKVCFNNADVIRANDLHSELTEILGEINGGSLGKASRELQDAIRMSRRIGGPDAASIENALVTAADTHFEQGLPSGIKIARDIIDRIRGELFNTRAVSFFDCMIRLTGEDQVSLIPRISMEEARKQVREQEKALKARGETRPKTLREIARFAEARKKAGLPP